MLEALEPWDSGRRYLNFAESRMDPRSIFPPETFERFERAKARYDPTGMFRANHSWRRDPSEARRRASPPSGRSVDVQLRQQAERVADGLEQVLVVLDHRVRM